MREPSGFDLYYEEAGEGVSILLIPPAGSTASTWGSAAEELARVGRVITYDRRGYARTGGEPPQSMSAHTGDAAALLEHLRAAPAVVVGTSAGAGIAVDLAVRRPELVRAVVAHEFPWRAMRHMPTGGQVAALAKIGSLALRRRYGDAAETLLHAAYSYRDGGSAWDAFPEEWRRVARENGRTALADFRNSVRSYPPAADLATVTVPVVCTYGERSPSFMSPLVRALASAMPMGTTRELQGAGHAAPFDATTEFVRLVGEVVASSGRAGPRRRSNLRAPAVSAHTGVAPACGHGSQSPGRSPGGEKRRPQDEVPARRVRGAVSTTAEHDHVAGGGQPRAREHEAAHQCRQPDDEQSRQPPVASSGERQGDADHR
jgi:pimeloyl-ACP methyl ester carboxylesterase